MDFNALIVAITSGFPNAFSHIAEILVEAFIFAMFAKHGDKKNAAHSVKANVLGDFIAELYKDNKITGTDLVKCTNLAAIAKLADKKRAEQDTSSEAHEHSNSYNASQTYDFEWFLRFFERAGYATKEEMQELWASVLNGEINNRGSFSYKAIETLFHMSVNEANLFDEMAKYSIVTPYAECMLPCSSELYANYDTTSPVIQSGHSDIYSIIAAAYGINNERVQCLIESGLLSSLLTTSNFIVSHDPIYITNDQYALSLKLKSGVTHDGIEIDICGYRFTSVARQLFGVMHTEMSLPFFLDFARLIKRRYSEIEVHIYNIITIDENGIELDEEYDYLFDSQYLNYTKLQELNECGDFDIV